MLAALLLTGLDTDALMRARIAARRRDPDGRRMGTFRWAEIDGAVWLFPATLIQPTGLVPMAVETRWQVAEPARPAAFAYWLATAARQDLWRALKGVPGLVPVLRVAPDSPPRAVAMTIGALVPERRVSAAIRSVIEDLPQPGRINAWTAWAERKAAAAGR